MTFNGVEPGRIFSKTMIVLASLLLVAQSALIPAPSVSPASLLKGSSVESHRHHHGLSTTSPAPAVRVTIVNATCVPSIALGIGIHAGQSHDHDVGTESTSGTKTARSTRITNIPVAYPDFRQGEWTANHAISTPEIQYAVHDTNGPLMALQTIHFKPLSSQYLLLTGDLSTQGPAEKLPQLLGEMAPRGVYPPNLQFQIIPYALVTPDPCHYRIVNAMPKKTLLLRSQALGNRPSEQLAYLAPGNSVLLVRQPPCVTYEAVIDDQTIPLKIEQEGAAGNCLIPFFLRNGKPDFVRVFEDP